MSTAFLVTHNLEEGLLLPWDKPPLAAALGSPAAVDTPGGWSSLWSVLPPSDIPLAAAPQQH